MASKMLLTTLSKNKSLCNLEKLSRHKGSATEAIEQSFKVPKLEAAGGASCRTLKSALSLDDRSHGIAMSTVLDDCISYLSEEPFPVIEWKFDDHAPMKSIGYPTPRATYFCVLEGE
jgi:hypothetical protein